MSTTFLERSLDDAYSRLDAIRERSRHSIRAASNLNPSDIASSMGNPGVFSIGDGGILSKHSEQYKHYRGWVYVAIKCIAQRLASLPVRMGKISPTANTPTLGRGASFYKSPSIQKMPPSLRSKAMNGSVEVIDNHEILSALQDPNPVMVPWAIMFVTAASIKLTGKSYWWMPKVDGRVQVWPLPADWVRPVHTKGRLFDHYLITPPHGATSGHEVPAEEIAYFSLPDPSNPLQTVSPLQSQAHAVGIDEQIQTAQFRAFKNGIFPNVVLTMGRLPGAIQGDPGQRPVLEPHQRVQLIDSIQQLYGGTMNYNDPVIIDGMVESVQKLSNSIAEMDFLQSGESVKARIFQAFGVNPIVAGENVNVGYAQAAVAEQIFLQQVVNPLAELIGQVMTKWVRATMNSGNDDIVLWLEEAKPNDAAQKNKDWLVAINGGAVKKNEVRTHLLGLPPLDGDEGEEFASKVNPSDSGDATDDSSNGQVDQEEGDEGSKAFFQKRCELLKKLHLGNLDKNELRVGKAANRFFKKQSRSVSKEFRDLVRESPQLLLDSGSVEMIVDRIFHPKEWDEDLRKTMFVPLARAAVDGALIQMGTAKMVSSKEPDISDFGRRLPTGVQNRISDTIKESLDQPYWSEINTTSRTAIASALDVGIQAKMTPAQISASISQTIGDPDGKRSAMIARTETTNAVNSGHQASLEELGAAGLVSGKQWLTIGDRDVRSSHSFLDGSKTRGVNGTFSVGGFEAPYPGHFSLPASERINCRCTMIAVISDDLSGGDSSGTSNEAPVGENAIPEPKIKRTDDIDVAIGLGKKTVSGRISPDGSDLALAGLAKKQGFNSVPKVVSDSELSEMVAGGATELWRGDSTLKAFDSLAEKDRFMGLGLYGNGTYAASGKSGPDVALRFAGDGGYVRHLALRKSAKVIKFDSLLAMARKSHNETRHLLVSDSALKEVFLSQGKKFTKEGAELYRQGLKTLHTDMGVFGTLHGYDAIVVPEATSGADYHVILNRNAVVLSDKKFTRKDLR